MDRGEGKAGKGGDALSIIYFFEMVYSQRTLVASPEGTAVCQTCPP